MDILRQKKVEELTLYLIELKKENELQAAEISGYNKTKTSTMYMKKLGSVVFMITMYLITTAQGISQTEAEAAAGNFMGFVTGSSIGRVAAKGIDQTILKTYNSHNSYYVVTFEGGGYVVLSATSNYEPILEYSEGGVYSDSNQPPAYVWWMEGYELEIDSIITNNIQTTEFDQAWDELSQPSTNARARGTNLLTSEWGQSHCIDALDDSGVSRLTYNKFVNDGGGDGSCDPCGGVYKCLAGCVAIAATQIMRYWGYPSLRYDWCNMPDRFQDSSTDTEVNAVAGLVADFGSAVGMDYCDGGECASGAYSGRAENVLQDYGYYADIRAQATRIGPWRTMLRAEIDAGRPVYYAGRKDGSGHAWVIDGVDPGNDRRFHFNWGWRGYENDRYYYLKDENPYKRWMQAIVGIRPRHIINCDHTADLGEVFDSETAGSIQWSMRMATFFRHQTPAIFLHRPEH